MVKKSSAPKNFYSAAQAARRLGLPKTTFFTFIRKEGITRVVPPGQVEGYYPKAEIDKIAAARDLITLQYATDLSVFRRAEEKDIQGITDLGITLFGTSTTPSYEDRLACWKKNPYAYYVVEQDGLIVGYLIMTPLKEEAIARAMGETKDATSAFITIRSEIVIPENILPFTKKDAKNVFLTLAVRQGLPRSKAYGMKLILGGNEVIKDLARRGIIIKRFYAASRTPDGIRLCRAMGFEEKETNQSSPVKRFWMDTEKTKTPLLREYQQIVKEYQRLHDDGEN